MVSNVILESLRFVDRRDEHAVTLVARVRILAKADDVQPAVLRQHIDGNPACGGHSASSRSKFTVSPALGRLPAS